MNNGKESILITGGLGQIGFYSYLQLREKYQISILDNMLNAKVSPPEDILFIKGDIKDKEIYDSLPEIDYIIHCAAQISPEKSVEKPIFDAKINILGTLQLLEYARKKDISKFLLLSSAATYGNPQFLPITETHPRNPISPYGISKLVSEKYTLLYADLYNLDTIVLLPFNVYSDLQKENDPYAGVIYKFIKSIKNNKAPVIQGDGHQTRDFIHVKDVARAIEIALNKRGVCKTINIGSGEPISILELANMLIKFSKSDLEPVFDKPREGDIRESYASTKTAKLELGFTPEIKLEKGLEELFNQI
ncbi:MAG: NAD-dependent epimerase/dehydratase family protein [Candidatus Heimdallarchaeaceae archaeon]|jgi:UDP-glucose 4-epimerase